MEFSSFKSLGKLTAVFLLAILSPMVNSQSYDLVLGVSPQGSGSIECTSNPVTHGENITCMAKANAGYRFIGWGDNCFGNVDSCTLENVTSEKSIMATFQEAQSFIISASIKMIQHDAFPALMSSSRPDSLRTLLIVCSKESPVAKGETVICYPTYYGKETSRGDFMYWSGDCSRREGRNCVIENIENDKQLTLHIGYRGYANSEPDDAGSLWCDSHRGIGGIWDFDYANTSCAVQKNPGYRFDNMIRDPRNDINSINQSVILNFLKQKDVPSVSCYECTSYSVTTDNYITDTALFTSREDENLISTQAVASITTNIETKDISTTVSVNNQKLEQITRGARVVTNNPMAIVSLISSTTAILQESNPENDTITSAQFDNNNATISTLGVLNPTTIMVAAGHTAVIKNIAPPMGIALTQVSLSDRSDAPIGNTYVSLAQSIVEITNGNSVITAGGVSINGTFSTMGATLSTAVNNMVESLIKIDVGSSINAVIEGISSGASNTLRVTANSGSIVIVTGGDFDLGNNQFRDDGTFIELAHHKNDTGRKIAVDLKDNSLKAITIYSDISGVVELFKPVINGPVLTSVTANDASLDMTLTFSAAQ